MDRSFSLYAVALLALLAVPAQSSPQINIPPEDANTHIVNRVEPTVPPLAKATKIGGAVRLHIVISPTGDVSAVNVISGHPMLVASAVAAVRKWKYQPFAQNGTATAVATEVEIDFPSGMSTKESEARNRFFPIEDECRRLINSGQYSQAEKKCREAVSVSDELPKDVVLERSGSLALLANSIFLQRRPADAIPYYEKALALNKGYLKPDDADLATDYANLARAYAAVGDLSKADSLYSESVTTFEAAIKGLPAMKENYTRRLKRTLNEYARLKQARGMTEAADELRTKAATLP